MNQSSRNIPKIGISRCLPGDAVRYDGKSEPNPELIKKLQEDFDLLSICPEVEAGLSIPRPAVQLTGSIKQPRITGRDDPALDITDLMQAYCKIKPAELSSISGFVFKSRSPSCGLGSTPVFINGKVATQSSNGVFAQAIIDTYPELPVIEETNLQNHGVFEDFKISVFRYNARLE
jgi:uncharacterized protein YbbK (DUF523 family)